MRFYLKFKTEEHILKMVNCKEIAILEKTRLMLTAKHLGKFKVDYHILPYPNTSHLILYFNYHILITKVTVSLGIVSLKFKSSFFTTKYTSLGADLPPKSFIETVPRHSIQFTMIFPVDHLHLIG